LSKLLFVPIALACAIFAIANRSAVAIDLWPLPQSVDLPLSAAMFGAALVGFLIGAVVTWYGAVARRRQARRAIRPAAPFQPALPTHHDGRAPILARYRAAVDEA
jgi:uncharacterized integral membrane protein